MMKRFLLGFALCAISAPAWAACAVTNLQVKDNAAVTAAVPYADDGSGASNCSPQIQLKQGGNVATIPAAGADTVSNSTPGLQGFNFPFWFNGTTWDRARGDATNGAFVNVKTSVLSTGAATSANQSTEITALQAIQASSATTATNTAAAVPAGTFRIGYTSDDPCTQLTKTNFAIATSAGTLQLVAPSGSTQVYICSFSLISAATAVVNLVGGTGATCTTGTPVAALGSTTAANGASLAANGGLTFGNGGATALRTTTAGHGLCLIQSGTTALAGNITFVQQ